MFKSSYGIVARFAVLLGVLFVCCQSARAAIAEHQSALTPYVSSDTFAVAYIDVTSIKVPDNLGSLFKAAPQLSGGAQAMAFFGLFVQDFLKHFQEAGGKGVYVIAGLADIHVDGGPLLVATAQTGQSTEKVEQAFKIVVQQIQKNTSGSDASQTTEQLKVERKGEVVLVGMKATMDRYTTIKADERKELVDPLAKLADGGAVASLVFCPGPDFRRVVRELWPELPGALAPLRGEMADRWISLEASINQPPNINPHLALQAKDSESAQVFAKLWHDLPQAPAAFGGNDQSTRQVQGYAQMLVDTLPAKVEGTRVEIGFPAEASQFAALGSMLGEAANKSMESSHRRARMDQFKQLLLAMLNFEAANKHLPPAAICNNEGKPLLSWRVAILPYLDEMKLYKQFHLDEAWDSPHNLPLVAKMPTIFADPDSAIQSVAGEGKTLYQVPVGKDTMFFNNEGAILREITDGTANTIAIVQVAPQAAVEWTKPADWNVDMDHPREGLGGSSREYVLAGYADGHVTMLTGERLNDKRLRAQLTRAGGEATNP